MTDVASFARLIAAVNPWASRLVLVGGWAHRLHRLHPKAEVPDHPPLITLDADLAFDNPQQMQGDIKSALGAAGFHETLSGEHTPPVSHFELGEEGGGFYAEFLTPLRGSGFKRTGELDATVAAAGVTAQKLRHLELLLTVPWEIHLRPNGPISVAAETVVKVPNPVSFMIQKLLIHEERRPEKRAQDVLYLHDTLILFGAHEESLRTLWLDAVRPTMTDKQARAVTACLDKHFSEVNDTIRKSALLAAGRRLEPSRIQALCRSGLEAIIK